jgi:hypothetical protein
VVSGMLLASRGRAVGTFSAVPEWKTMTTCGFGSELGAAERLRDLGIRR